MDDQAVAHAQHLDVGRRDRPPGRHRFGVVVVLGDDHLGIRGLVHDDVLPLEPQGAGEGAGEPFVDRRAAGDAGRPRHGLRVFDDGVFGVERGKLLPASFADAVGQRGEHLAG
jgi:hypothetical protein